MGLPMGILLGRWPFLQRGREIERERDLTERNSDIEISRWYVSLMTLILLLRVWVVKGECSEQWQSGIVVRYFALPLSCLRLNLSFSSNVWWLGHALAFYATIFRFLKDLFIACGLLLILVEYVWIYSYFVWCLNGIYMINTFMARLINYIIVFKRI